MKKKELKKGFFPLYLLDSLPLVFDRNISSAYLTVVLIGILYDLISLICKGLKC